jgi:hypothetical protein
VTPPRRPVARRPLARYGIAAVSVALAFLVRWSLGLSFGDRPLLILFVVPILLSAYLRGLGLGLLATVLVGAGTEYLLIPPTWSFAIERGVDAIQWLVLCVVGVLASILAEALHRARRRAEAAHVEVGRARQALEESEEQFRTIADALPQLAWMARPDGYVFWYNERWYDYTGATLEEAQGWGWQSLHDPSVLPSVLERWRASLATGRPFDMEFPLRGRDGRFRWFLTRCIPLRDPADHVVRWVGTHTDVSDKRATDEALRRSEAQLQTVFENLSEGLVVADLDGNIDYWNRTALEMHGYASLDECRRRLPEFADTFELSTLDGTPLPLGSWPLARILRGERLRDCEVRVRRTTNGWLRVFSYNGDLVRDPTGQSLLACVTIRDVTLRKRAEAERERLLGEVGARRGELESLLYVTSHDLRVPLVNIQGFGLRLEQACTEVCDRLEPMERAGVMDPATKDGLRERIGSAIHYIQSSATKMDALIGGMLHVSRAGRAALRVEELDLDRMLEAILASMRTQIEQADAAVEVATLPRCWGDAGQIDQVFTNLIDNALKYRDPRRPLHVRISGEAGETRAVYSVADTGVGIAPDHRAKVWELFHRLDPRGSAEGEGLGLTLVKRIVECHGGRVWLESTLGQGSRFYVALPRGPLTE